MEGASFKNLLLGFVAGAIAMVTAHELVSLWLANAGFTSRVPWSMDPTPLSGLPQIAVDALIGGVWGAFFAAVLGDVPQGSMTLRGMFLGVVGPALIGTLVLLPILNREALFLGGNPDVIWPVLVMGGGFGAVAAWLYGFFTSGLRLP